MRLLSIDVGTTSVKVGLVDDSGVLSVEERPIATATPTPGWVEQNTDDWWQATRQAIIRLAPRNVDGISVTGQMQDVIAMSNATPLRPAILYSDQRAVDEHAYLSGRLDESWGKIALATPDHTNVAAKWMWLRGNEPSVVADTTVVLLGAAGFVVHRLTGNATCDRTTAATTGLYDSLAGSWWTPVGEITDIPLPTLTDGVAGRLSAEAASQLGLDSGLPVVHAPGDAVSTSLGVLGTDVEIPYVYLGTTGWVGRFDAAANPREGVIVLPALDKWLTVAPMLNAGSAIDWVRELLGLDTAAFDRLAADGFAAESGVLFLPHLDGVRLPRPDPHTSGTLVGLRRSTRPADIAVAAYEGVARTLAGLLDHVSHAQPASLSVCGGGSRSDVWCQTIADVSGLDVHRVSDEHASLRGASSAARLALGTEPHPRPGTLARFHPRAARSAAHLAARIRVERIESALFGATFSDPMEQIVRNPSS